MTEKLADNTEPSESEGVPQAAQSKYQPKPADPKFRAHETASLHDCPESTNIIDPSTALQRHLRAQKGTEENNENRQG